MKTKSAFNAEIQKHLAFITSQCTLLRTPTRESFVTVPVNGHKETYEIRSPQFKCWFSGSLYKRDKTVVTYKVMEEVINHCEAQAQYEAAEEPVFTRLAAYKDRVYLDLGDPSWSVIEITGEGWQVCTSPPVKFRRPQNLGELPKPVPN